VDRAESFPGEKQLKERDDNRHSDNVFLYQTVVVFYSKCFAALEVKYGCGNPLSSIFALDYFAIILGKREYF